jgi:predicted neuraminidase
MIASLELYPTMITPFSEDQTIDYPAVARLIDHFARLQCDGVFAVCQSSEMFFLSDAEKLELAAFCIRRCHEWGMKCVVSGHTQDHPAEQTRYLQHLERLAPDAVILVSNRLAASDEPDTVVTARLEQLIRQLQPGTRLGIYECPYPYKRLLTPVVLGWMIRSGRFDFLKDTCCQIEMIRQRLAQLAGSSLRLYNANAATLLDSFLAGAVGYSGVMLNLIPELLMRLKQSSSGETSQAGHVLPTDKRLAGTLADVISLLSVIECQNYPANAKYVLQQKGVIASTVTRNGKPPLTESQQKELIAFMNCAAKELARLDRLVKSERLFDAGSFFPSCHASTVLPLPDGIVLAAYFAGQQEGAPDVGIWLSRRVDGRWQDPVCVAKQEAQPHWNPVLFLAGTTVRLVYKVGASVSLWQSRTMVSQDWGLTWSQPVSFAQSLPDGGPVRSKPIVLPDGRLLAPNSTETAAAWRPRVDVSDDGGAHFAVLADMPLNSDQPQKAGYLAGKGAIQPTLWASAPGQIHMLLRTTCGRIFRSDSTDHGQTWCQAYDAGLPNNNSGIDVARHGGCLYLVFNPVSGNWASRNPLIVCKSTDNGRSFLPFATLEHASVDPETGASAEYSYPAAVVQSDRLHITYTVNRRQIGYAVLELVPAGQRARGSSGL